MRGEKHGWPHWPQWRLSLNRQLHAHQGLMPNRHHHHEHHGHQHHNHHHFRKESWTRQEANHFFLGERTATIRSPYSSRQTLSPQWGGGGLHQEGEQHELESCSLDPDPNCQKKELQSFWLLGDPSSLLGRARGACCHHRSLSGSKKRSNDHVEVS